MEAAQLPIDFSTVVTVLPAEGMAPAAHRIQLLAAKRFGVHLHSRGRTFGEADTNDCATFQKTGAHPATVRCVAQVYREMQKGGLRADNPWLPLFDSLNVSMKPRPVLDVDAILAGSHPGKERIAILLLGKMGLRPREATNLRFRDLHLAEDEPFVTIGARRCAVPSAARSTLEQDLVDLALQPQDVVLGWSGLELRRVVESIGRRIAIEVSPLDLRRSWAYQHWLSGAPQ